MTDITKFWIFLLDFEMKTVCVVGLISFAIYYVTTKKLRKSQAQSVSTREMLCALAFCIYLGILLSGMLIDRQVTEEMLYVFTPFWSYIALFHQWHIFLALQMIYNVLVFLPWGILLPNIWPRARRMRWVLLSVGVFSFGIEMLQLVCKRGLFEFDDVIHNVLGAVIGYGVWRVGRKWKQK